MEPVGNATTSKLTPLLAVSPTVTTTLPELAPEGTFATITLSLHFAIDASLPLNVTVLEPCCPPKFDPEICTEAPKTPEVVDKLLMAGGPAGGVTKLECDEPPPQPTKPINSSTTRTADTLS